MAASLYPDIDFDERNPSEKNKIFPLRISVRDYDMLEELKDVTGKKKNWLLVDAIKQLHMKIFSLQIPHSIELNKDEEYTMIMQIRLNPMQKKKLDELAQKLDADKSAILRSSLHEKYRSVIMDGPGTLF